MACGKNGVYDHTQEHADRHAAEEPKYHHVARMHAAAQIREGSAYDDCCNVCLDIYEGWLLAHEG